MSHSEGSNSLQKCSSPCQNQIIYYCCDPECHKFLCLSCKRDHVDFHIYKKTYPQLLSYSLVLSETKQKLIAAQSKLDTFIIHIKNEEAPDSPLLGKSPGHGQEKQHSEFENIVRELEGTKEQWRIMLRELNHQNPFDVLQKIYQKDLVKELETIQLDTLRKCSKLKEMGKKEELPKALKQSLLDIGNNSRTSTKGLGNVLKKVREVENKKGQPLQNGDEEAEERNRGNNETKKNMKSDYYISMPQVFKPSEIMRTEQRARSFIPSLNRENVIARNVNSFDPGYSRESGRETVVRKDSFAPSDGNSTPRKTKFILRSYSESINSKKSENDDTFDLIETIDEEEEK